MNEREIYDQWAPPGNPWSAWAKPVLFTQMEHALAGSSEPVAGSVPWENAADLAHQRLAIILDLPGTMSVNLGLQLAPAGFRPVPLFNTSYGFNAIVPVQGIIGALAHGTRIIGTHPATHDAPPVFLLDSNRMRERGAALPGKYDNRWLVFPQDFPSAKFLQAQHIVGVVLVQEPAARPQDDLAHVLLRWQEAGLPILSATLQNPLTPEALRVEKPARYRSLWYHFLAIVGLRRNSAGGFGAVVPEPSQSGGFG